METPAVILTDTGKMHLTNISRHCLLHAIEVLRPHHNLSIVLPRSGSHKIDSFCEELLEAIHSKQSHKKSLPLLPEDPLIPPIEIHRFCEGATNVGDFTLLVEEKFLVASKGNINLDALHRCCWKYYEMERKAEISFPKWFSRECTYRLWLIFNCVLDCEMETTLSLKTTNEVLKRLIEFCGYTWNHTYTYDTTQEMKFPQYLMAITIYFEKFKLETSLTCEVIADMVDEIVNGVLKTGKLTKKGHKRKNWKRRWFVLQRTTLRYYENRDTMSLKGQLVLNGKTEVKTMPDRGKRKFCFEVTCGHTGKPFEIAADDHRMKHEWMLAIKKAIALARVMDGSSQEGDFTESLAGFYLLKYGTPQPALSRQDSTVRKMKFHATLRDQRRRLSGKRDGANGMTIEDDLDSSTEADEYLPMNPVENISSDDSSGDEEGKYVPMKPIAQEFMESSYDSTMSCSPLVDSSQSLPPALLSHSPTISHSSHSSGSFSGLMRTTQDRPSVLEPTPERDEEEEKSDIRGSGDYDNVAFEESIRLVSRKTSDPKRLEPSIEDKDYEGSYIQVVESQPNRNRPIRSKTHSSNSTLERSYEEPKNWTTNTKCVPSSELYLTLIHSNDDLEIKRAYTDSSILSPTRSANNGSDSSAPPVPVHRASPSPVTSPHHFKFSASDKQALNDTNPPTPPPRVKTITVQNSAPNLNDPPPIPQRKSSNPTSPMSPPRDLSASAPEHALRRSTMTSPSARDDTEEHFMHNRSPSHDGNYYVRDPLAPPPIPPR